MKLVFTILLVALSANAGPTPLAWNAPTNAVDGYRLYGGTNSLLRSLTNALVKIDTGTNRFMWVDALLPGTWFFVATAYKLTTNGIPVESSATSNEIMFEVPAPPPNLFPVIVQWNGEIGSTNWRDAIFLKFKLNIP